MSSLKISFIWVHDIGDVKNSIFFSLLKKLSKKKIEIVNWDKAEILIIGPYDFIKYKRRVLNFFLKTKKLKKILNFFPNIDIYSLKRNYKPIRIFLSEENIRCDLSNIDFSFNSEFQNNNKNHFRFPHWKDHLEWSHEGVERNLTNTAKRFGEFMNINDLLKPQGNSFLKKKDVCIFSSHLLSPRKEIFDKFSEHFNVKGYGPIFNSSIKNHNESNFSSIDIMKNYSFNLCPENSIYPGYYTERVPNSFIAKTLPITWADKNISRDFNPRSFVNLLDYSNDNYEIICNLLKDYKFLEKYTNEPLLLSKPNLDNEFIFINKILSLI